jgi:hypothetical protein
MVRRHMKETPKAAQPSKVVVQRRILMSMRWAEGLKPSLGWAAMVLLSSAFLAATPLVEVCLGMGFWFSAWGPCGRRDF